MLDFLESLEIRAEIAYNEMLLSDGRLKCKCGREFDLDKERGLFQQILILCLFAENV